MRRWDESAAPPHTARLAPRSSTVDFLGDNHHAAQDGEDMAPTKRIDAGRRTGRNRDKNQAATENVEPPAAERFSRKIRGLPVMAVLYS